MCPLGKHILPLVVFALRVSLVAAFSPTHKASSQRSSRQLHQLYASSKKKSPLDRLLNVVESAQASVQDYLFMRPSRPIPPGMRRVQTQFIAALGDPKARSGTNAQEWGIWRIDPGPRGIYLTRFDKNMKAAPAGWTWDKNEFWIEEYGRIMEKPSFPAPTGKYVVTGGRAMTTVLTIDPPASGGGEQRWRLQDGTLYDVTHLPCRAAKYNPSDGSDASPANANASDFPVTPGAVMPAIEGCTKQDYAVLFVIAIEDD